MIWYFLAGMIAGAVGWHKLIQWLGRKFEEEKETKGEEYDRG